MTTKRDYSNIWKIMQIGFMDMTQEDVVTKDKIKSQEILQLHHDNNHIKFIQILQMAE